MRYGPSPSRLDLFSDSGPFLCVVFKHGREALSFPFLCFSNCLFPKLVESFKKPDASAFSRRVLMHFLSVWFFAPSISSASDLRGLPIRREYFFSSPLGFSPTISRFFVIHWNYPLPRGVFLPNRFPNRAGMTQFYLFSAPPPLSDDFSTSRSGRSDEDPPRARSRYNVGPLLLSTPFFSSRGFFFV